MSEAGNGTITAVRLRPAQRQILDEMTRRRGPRTDDDQYGRGRGGVIREALAEKARRMGIDDPWPPYVPWPSVADRERSEVDTATK